jgi:hypothetical protein
MPSPSKLFGPLLAISIDLSLLLKTEKKLLISSPFKLPIPPLEISVDFSMLLKATIKLLISGFLK